MTEAPRRQPAAGVVTLGECLVGFVATEIGPLPESSGFRRHVVGAEANVAIGLARLGVPVAYIGRVGEDQFGTTILRRLRGEGVDISALAVEPGAPTGLLFRERRAVGPSEVVYYRAGSAGSRLSPSDVSTAEPLFAAAAWFHVSGITPAVSASARDAVHTAFDLAARHGLTVSLDANLRRKLWSDRDAAATLGPLAARGDVVFAGLEEAAVVAGLPGERHPDTIAQALLATGARHVVIKLGAEGAVSADRDGSTNHRPGIQVETVVDHVGAGDAFCAGYIAGRLDGLDEAACLDLANACGAAVIGADGDASGAPTRAEAERLRTTSAQESIR